MKFQANATSNSNLLPMELYIHLPFCRSKCRYCDFASWAGQDGLMAPYVDALLKEAAAVQQKLPENVGIITVFIGGGTPSTLPEPLLKRLLSGLKETFPINADAEWTTEANPGTLTQEWLDTAVSFGVNRLSLGMQAYQPEMLKMLGRIHDFSQVEQAVSMARHSGISNISLDLMFGLPGQTTEMWLETLEKALSLQPKHLSCYGLIPEEGTPMMVDLTSGRLTLPDEETERQMYDDTLGILQSHGFEQYEISNFALPGYACRHNLGYWRQVPYIGLGASAASCLPGDGCAYLRRSNPPSIREYIEYVHSGSPKPAEEKISHDDAMFETLMLGLRTTKGVSETDFATMHGVSLSNYRGETLSEIGAAGLMEHIDGWWRLTRKGMDVQNAVLVRLMDK